MTLIWIILIAFIEEVSKETETNEDPVVVKTHYRKRSLFPGVLKGNIKPIVSGKE